MDEARNISFFELFKFSSKSDKLIIAFGIMFAVLEGAGLPLMSLVFGQMIDIVTIVIRNGFADDAQNTTTTTPTTTTPTLDNSLLSYLQAQDNSTTQQWPDIAVSDANLQQQQLASFSAVNESIQSTNSTLITVANFESQMTNIALFYILLGCLVYVSSVIQIWCLQFACERQIRRIRNKFFKNIIRQEINWFDKNQSGSLASKLNDDVERIRDGLGDQLSLCIKSLSTFVSGFIIGFTSSWKLTLVLMLCTPIMALFSAFIGKMMATSVKREQEKYAQAGAIAEEVFVAVRTVFSLSGQKREIKSFKKKLDEGRKISTRKYLKMSILIGLSMFTLYTTYGIALYVSVYLIDTVQLNPGMAMTVLMSVMMGAGALGNIIPPLQTVLSAVSSASLIYSIIDSEPTIDASNERGLRLSKIVANIRFDNVSFAYPLRSSLPVIRNMSLDFKQGQTIALVGKTGSGKSTIINLLLRFYNPSHGAIYLDNCNYADLNVAWLRSKIGLVEQEPALFDCSVAENIALGATSSSQQSSDCIVAAAKLANAHEFIMSLPDDYNTRCGNRGYQMSGGQKQRIAIARALISDPKILLLDEATSALDSTSEAVVQAALGKARKGRTTVIIAHRLSTIRDADLVLVLDGGAIVERGNHDELMALQGHYHSLVTNQVFNDTLDGDGNVGGYATDGAKSRSSLAANDSDSDRSVAGGGRISLERTASLRGSGVLDSASTAALLHSASLGKNLANSSSRRKLSTNFGSINWQRAYTKSGDSSPLLGPTASSGESLDESQTLTMSDILALLRPQAVILTFGIVVSCLNGLLLPVFGLFYAQIIDTMSLAGDELYASGKFWSLMILVFAIISMVSMTLRIFLVATSIEQVTSRLRLECFTSIMHQHVGWFDETDNSPQRLTTRLATDVPQIKSVINSRLASLCSGAATIAAALAIAYAVNWKMAMLLTLALPLLIYIGICQMQIDRRDRGNYLRSMEDASRLATEVIENVKLVQAIGQERYFVQKFVKTLDKPYKEALWGAPKFAAFYGMSQASMYFVYGASFKFGSYLIANDDLNPTDMFRTFFAISFTAVAVGQWGGMSGDLSRAYRAVGNIKRLISMQPLIDNMSSGGIKPHFKGAISFSNVHFRYPTRIEVQVLQGLSLSIEPGKTLALVGPSGNGKSTIAALLVRFFDPDEGLIKIDNYDLRCINLEHLRRNVAIVSQEPTLFKASIRENILYGLDSSLYSMRDVVQAAKQANIDSFIQSLPLKYDTQVGERGTQMSGGQKQRIAIARALVRKPAILILDEATSALDSESEALINQALEEAVKGKTCIKIAHRLSTIRNSDSIAVVEGGKIVEQGSHDELMALGKSGFYFKLMQRQEEQ